MTPNPFGRFFAPADPPPPTLIPVADLPAVIARLKAEADMLVAATRAAVRKSHEVLARVRSDNRSAAPDLAG